MMPTLPFCELSSRSVQFTPDAAPHVTVGGATNGLMSYTILNARLASVPTLVRVTGTLTGCPGTTYEIPIFRSRGMAFAAYATKSAFVMFCEKFGYVFEIGSYTLPRPVGVTLYVTPAI